MSMVKKQKEQKQSNLADRTRRLQISRSANGLAELDDVERLLSRADARARLEPSAERWAAFNEHLMRRALAPVRLHPLSRQWRQMVYDRLTASDSRVKQNLVILTVLILAVLVVVVYFIG